MGICVQNNLFIGIFYLWFVCLTVAALVTTQAMCTATTDVRLPVVTGNAKQQQQRHTAIMAFISIW